MMVKMEHSAVVFRDAQASIFRTFKRHWGCAHACSLVLPAVVRRTTDNPSSGFPEERSERLVALSRAGCAPPESILKNHCAPLEHLPKIPARAGLGVHQHPKPGVSPSLDRSWPTQADPPPACRRVYATRKFCDMSMSPVRPAKPFAPYIGGKIKLSEAIIARINGIEHDLYAEPFVGMGGIFLRRTLKPKAEVINDFSSDVANVFRILEQHYVPLMDYMRFKLTTRTEFERLCKIDPVTLTDIQRAARFIYLQRTTFGGKVAGRVFGVTRNRDARFNIIKLGPLLEDVHERLAGVVIECLPYGDFIERYDTPKTLFYLDPPYFGCETDYGQNLFRPTDFFRLAKQLAEIKGNFILSINDVPEVRETFAAFEREEFTVTYSVSGKSQEKYPELVIYGGTTLTKEKWHAITQPQGGLF